MSVPSDSMASTGPGPSPASGVLRRRVRLLTWLQLGLAALLCVGVAVIAVAMSPAMPARISYMAMTGALAALMIAAWAMNRAGHYRVAAWVTVVVVSIPPWLALAVDEQVRAGDLMPLTYVVLSIVLTAMLLDTASTVVVAGVQWAALLLLSSVLPHSRFNWPSLLTLVFFLSVLAILYTIVTRRDTEQIEEQGRRIREDQRELHDRLVHDPLTGLFNWGHLAEVLPRTITQAQEDGMPVSLLVLDIDNFKAINDLYGHNVGDQVLRDVASVLRSTVRPSDIVFRFGGDEFVVIQPGLAADVAHARAAEELLHLRSIQLPDAPTQLQVSVSGGIASYPDHATNSEDLFRRADAALLEAKRSGRNRLELSNKYPNPLSEDCAATDDDRGPTAHGSWNTFG